MTQAIDKLDHNELQALLAGAPHPGPHASLYMPTIMAGPETRQNPIRYKNLLRDLERELGEQSDLLGGARQLLDNQSLWQHANTGFALFAANEVLRYYRLPIAFDELIAVSGRFYLKPLLRLFGLEQQFYLLALSQNAVRLLHVDGQSVSPVELGDTPTSLSEALGKELSPQQLQFHSGGGANGTPIYHGQGAGEDDIKPEIELFCKRLDKGVVSLTGGHEQTAQPLVLAGVDFLISLYRAASSHKVIVADGVTGNPEDVGNEALAEQARPLAKRFFDRALAELQDQFYASAAGGRASDKLEEIIPAALDGRIDTLFVARGERCWGHYDRDRRQLERHVQATAASEELLDLAAVSTFSQSGQVLICDPQAVPGKTSPSAAAIFRY